MCGISVANRPVRARYPVAAIAPRGKWWVIVDGRKIATLISARRAEHNRMGATPPRYAHVRHLKPRDAKDVEAALRWALAEGKTLEIVGAGLEARHRPRRAVRPHASTSPASPASRSMSRRSWCSPPKPARRSPRSRRCSPRRARSLRSSRWITARCSARPPGSGTIGGVLAANLSGPRRIKAGAARDHFLGFTAVSGRGETFKSGGRVVKNVTGYDLCKLLAGSWGTLAAMTDVTVKVLPSAETEETLLVLGLDDAAASGDERRDGLVARRLGRRASAGAGRGGAPGRIRRRRSPRCGSKASRRRSRTEARAGSAAAAARRARDAGRGGLARLSGG